VYTDWRHGRLLSSNKFVPSSFLRLHPSIGIPSHASSEEVEKRLVITLKHLLKTLRGGTASASFRRYSKTRFSERVKEKLFARALLNQMLLGRSKYFHDARKLFLLVLAREYRNSRE
jgi:hypothetical protein